MPRMRTITVAGVFAGATILGGAGLAGAADSDSTIADVGLQEVEAELLQSSTAAGADDETSPAEETGESTLPDAAGDRAAQARAAQSTSGDDGTIETGDTASTDDPAALDGGGDGDSTEYRNHGDHVSETAQDTPPGPGHGEAVSAVARQHGEEQRAEHQDEDAEDDETQQAEPTVTEDSADPSADSSTDPEDDEGDDGLEDGDDGLEEGDDDLEDEEELEEGNPED